MVNLRLDFLLGVVLLPEAAGLGNFFTVANRRLATLVPGEVVEVVRGCLAIVSLTL